MASWFAFILPSSTSFRSGCKRRRKLMAEAVGHPGQVIADDSLEALAVNAREISLRKVLRIATKKVKKGFQFLAGPLLGAGDLRMAIDPLIEKIG